MEKLNASPGGYLDPVSLAIVFSRSSTARRLSALLRSLGSEARVSGGFCVVCKRVAWAMVCAALARTGPRHVVAMCRVDGGGRSRTERRRAEARDVEIMRTNRVQLRRDALEAIAAQLDAATVAQAELDRLLPSPARHRRRRGRKRGRGSRRT